MDRLTLKAGETLTFGETGSYFRILSAQALVNARFEGDGWSVETPLLAGLGLNFRNRPTPFERIRITSEVEQTIEIFAGFDEVDDDRLSGSLDFNGAVSVLTTLPAHNAWVIKNVAAGGEIFPARTTRRALSFKADANITLESGQPIGAGQTVEWNTSGALKLHATSAPAKIEIMEDYD